MPDYFAAMGIVVKQGRSFTGQDRIGSQAVVVIDENLARQHWPNGDAVGQRMRRNDSDPWATIVGVVASVRRTRLVGAESDTEGIIGAGKGVYYYPLFHPGIPISTGRVRRPHFWSHAPVGIPSRWRSPFPPPCEKLIQRSLFLIFRRWSSALLLLWDRGALGDRPAQLLRDARGDALRHWSVRSGSIHRGAAQLRKSECASRLAPPPPIFAAWSCVRASGWLSRGSLAGVLRLSCLRVFSKPSCMR